MALGRVALLVDSHTHPRDFNQSYKGTFESETKAMLLNGVGTAIAMPNTDPPLVTAAAIGEARNRAKGRIYCDLGFYFGTQGYNTIDFYRVLPFVKGLKVYANTTTGNLHLSDSALVERVVEAWPVAKPILFHAEGAGLLESIFDLGFKHGKKIHICHVSLAEEVRVIKEAKERGLPVTAEVCPHHLLFTENDLPKLGGYGRMKPELATTRDLEALWEGVRTKIIDVIATDHAPHSEEEKASSNPPFGVIGEPTFPVVWKLFHDRGLTLNRLFEMMRYAPARIFDIQLPNLSEMYVDLDEEYTFERSAVLSKAGRSPYEGMEVRGRIRQVFLRGYEVVRDGQVIGPPRGEVI